MLLDVDQKSIASVGVWPWPRDVRARVLDREQSAAAGLLGCHIGQVWLFGRPAPLSAIRLLLDAPAHSRIGAAAA